VGLNSGAEGNPEYADMCLERQGSIRELAMFEEFEGRNPAFWSDSGHEKSPVESELGDRSSPSPNHHLSIAQFCKRRTNAVAHHRREGRRITVTKSNKERLFGDNLQKLGSRRSNTEGILHRLKDMDPVTAQKLKLKEVALSKIPLRMLLVDDDHNQSEVETYTALSYCWHSTAWTPASGLIPPEPDDLFPVSFEMSRLLLENRKSPAEGIWVDQVCINQEYENDKQVAIASMDFIYSNARQAIIVLEDIRLSGSEDALLFRAGWMDISDSRWGQEFLRRHGGLLEAVLCISMLTEEILLRPSVFIQMEEICNPYFADQQDLRDQRDAVIPAYNSLFSLTTVPPESENTYVIPSLRDFRRSHALGCTLISDKTSIAINTCGLGLSFTGSVHTDDECHWIFLLLALAAGDTSALATTGEVFCLHGDQKTRIWYHKPHANDGNQYRILPRLLESQHIAAINPKQIILDLLFLDQTQAEIASYGSLLRAAELVNLLLIEGWHFFTEDTHRLAHVVPSVIDENFDNCRAMIAQDLAISLECGIPWMVRALHSNHLEALYCTETDLDLETVVDLWPAISDLLAGQGYEEGLTWDDLEASKLPLLQYMRFVTNYPVLGNLQSPAHIPTSTAGDRAVTSLPRKVDSKVWRLAIPVPLADPAYSECFQVWVLSPLTDNPNGPWELLG